MSASTTMTVTIARPVEDVFAVLSDVKNVPIWSSNTIDETLLTPGPLRKGSRRRAVIKGFAGRTMQNEAEMIEFSRTGAWWSRFSTRPCPLASSSSSRLSTAARGSTGRILAPKGILAPTAFLAARFYRMAFEKDLKASRP